MATSPLGSRYWTLWSATTVANLGDGLSLAAFPLLAIELTDDARLVALVSFFRFLPFVVLGLPAGLLIDRTDRRWAAFVAQLGRAGIVLTLAAVVAGDQATIWLLTIAAFATGVGEIITDGGLPALVRDVVESSQLEVANARLAATRTVNNLFIGPPVGALLYELDRVLPFVATAACFAAGAVVLLRLRGSYRPEPDDEAEPLRQRLTVGLRYVWNHPVLRPMALVVAVFAFFSEAGNSVFVILVTERFGLGGLGFGLLISLDAVASVAMSFVVAPLVVRTSHGWSMQLSVVAFAVASLLLGLSTTVGAAILAMVISGVSDPTWNVVSSTVRQRLVPNAVFGRMMTAYLVIAWGIQPIGALAGGVVAEAWGPEWVYVMSGFGVGSLFIVGRRLFHRVDLAMASPVAH